MKELVLLGARAKMSSLEIAELCEKEHRHVLRDIRSMLESIENIEPAQIWSRYKDAKGEERPCAFLDFELTTTLITGYRVDIRYKVIQRWYELEQQTSIIPQTLPDALRLAADLAEKNESLKLEVAQNNQVIAELQPKATYYDLILQCKGLLSVSQIAKDYGHSAKWLNEKLRELGVQYRQGGVWLLYQKHADKGYTQSKTHVVNDLKSTFHTYWTQKGRIFIYELLKDEGYLPIIEQEIGKGA